MNPSILFLIYVLVVVAPVFFWLWFFWAQDKNEPEPPKLVAKLFFLGFVAVLAAIILEAIFDFFIFKDTTNIVDHGTKTSLSDPAFALIAISFFLAGPIEELAKYVLLKWAIFKNKQFNQIADGVIYAAVLALGFSLVENTGYFIDTYQNMSTGPFFFVVIFRGFVTTLLHVVTAGLVGYHLGVAKFYNKNKKGPVLIAIAFSSLIHGVYNVLIFFSFGLVVNLSVILTAFGYLIVRMKSKKAQKIWLNQEQT